MIEVNPYKDRKKIRDLESIRLKVVKENGMFPFRQEVIWKIDDEAEWPCLLYKTRYVFSIDPLLFCRKNQGQNLYYLTEQKNLVDSTRYFYARTDQRALTLAKMVELGISKESFW